jgi:hypothetical protein
MTTSWDCFDTLVTRARFDPLTVFNWMGEEYGLANFTQRRKAAESRAPSTLFSIYEELAKDFQWTINEKEYYKQKEIEAELKHCLPVEENLRKVQDGDLIVSDMYLPRETIEGILRKHGMNKAVSFYVSTGGKSSGTIWPHLPSIDLHIGDNFYSDVSSPQSYGIKALHYTDVHLSVHEQAVGGELALLMRVVRLANPYKPDTDLHRLWFEQAQLNVPALVLAAASLPKENLAFVWRDCVHLQRIHEQLHGTQNVQFHCSRVAMASGGDLWKKYAENTAKGKIIVDLQGSGRSVVQYWRDTFQQDPRLLYVTGMMVHGQALITTPTDVIERFNSFALGSMAQFPERFANEFDDEFLKCQKAAIDKAIEYMPFFALKESNLPLLGKIIQLMYHSKTPLLTPHQSNHCTSHREIDWPFDRHLDDKIAVSRVFGHE